MAMTNSKVGIDQVILITHIMKASTLPPKYPAAAPIEIPMSKEIKTAMNPIKKEIRVPTIKRLNKSLPYLSVPK